MLLCDVSLDSWCWLSRDGGRGQSRVADWTEISMALNSKPLCRASTVLALPQSAQEQRVFVGDSAVHAPL